MRGVMGHKGGGGGQDYFRGARNTVGACRDRTEDAPCVTPVELPRTCILVRPRAGLPPP